MSAMRRQHFGRVAPLRTSILLLIAGLALLIVPVGGVVAEGEVTHAAPTSFAPLTISMDAVHSKIARFAEAELGAQPEAIREDMLPLIAKLIEAGDHIDRVFWRQVSPNGWTTLRHYASQTTDPDARAVARLLRINYGPWDRMSGEEPFIGVRSRPLGASFYPPDLSRREVDAQLDRRPGDLAMFVDPYALVRREDGSFRTVPYSVAYAKELDSAARCLREAASLSKWDSLRRFLVARADALTSNDYLVSERLWMETGDSPLIVVLGPYEFYEDRLLNSKTAFEAILAIRDRAETARIGKLCARACELSRDFKFPPAVKRAIHMTPGVPITVADVIYTAGETRAGAQTTAFSLPNDARVVEEKGRWKVILRNVAQAKYLQSWQPLVKRVLASEHAAKVTFDAYFQLLMLGELARSVHVQPLPGKDGQVHDPRSSLRQRYNVLEEARTDAFSLLFGLTMVERGTLPKEMAERLMTTYLGAIFRVLRFGTGPHVTAKAICFNFLARQGVFLYDPTIRRYRVDMQNAPRAVTDLAAGIVTILARGDYRASGTLIAEHGVLPADVRAKLGELGDVPVDIFPLYTIRQRIRSAQR